MIRERRGVSFSVVDLVAKRDMCLRSEAADMHSARFADFCGSETRNKTCSFLHDVDKATLQAVKEGVLHVEELMAVAKRAHLCPHLVAMEASPQAHVIVADYNHLFSDLRERSLERLGLRLSDLIVIVDEAHNLPDRIRNSHSHRVTPFLLDQVAGEARGQKMKDIEADLNALRTALQSMAEQGEKAGNAKAGLTGEARTVVLAIEDLHTAFDAARNRGLFGSSRTLNDVVEQLQALANKVRKGTDSVVHAEQLAEALEDWGRFAGGALRYLKLDGPVVELHVRLLDPGMPAKLVFDRIHTGILMSGTLRPPEMTRDLLGLEPARTTVRTYPSPYDPANRPIVIVQGYSTRFSERGDELWDRIARTVEGITAATQGNVAAFCPSYAIQRELRLRLETKKELIVEDPGWSKGERDQVLDTLAATRKQGGGLLLGVLGGSFSEGVDFRDNLLSAVVVIGLPLAPPDLEQKAAAAYLDQRHPGKGQLYAASYPAMGKVLQAMGRGIRSRTDRCVVVLLDERYLGPPFRGLLPEDAVVHATRDPVTTAGALLAGFAPAAATR
jgi:DNA excision repair protein ERCC-2